MECTKVKCTRIQYHSLQSSNGNYLNSTVTQDIAAAGNASFVLPANCVLIGAFYNDDIVNNPWHFIDTQGNAVLTFPTLIALSAIQSEVLNNDSGETKLDSVLNNNKNMLGMFTVCGLVEQPEKGVQISNISGSTQTVRIVYIDYNF